MFADNQLAHSFEESPQAKLQPGAGRRSPPAVVESLKAVCVSLDDAVPACSRAGIDAENYHDETLGRVPDSAAAKKRRRARHPPASRPARNRKRCTQLSTSRSGFASTARTASRKS